MHEAHRTTEGEPQAKRVKLDKSASSSTDEGLDLSCYCFHCLPSQQQYDSPHPNVTVREPPAPKKNSDSSLKRLMNELKEAQDERDAKLTQTELHNKIMGMVALVNDTIAYGNERAQLKCASSLFTFLIEHKSRLSGPMYDKFWDTVKEKITMFSTLSASLNYKDFDACRYMNVLFPHINACTSCGIDMGHMNPRQLCGKGQCDTHEMYRLEKRNKTQTRGARKERYSMDSSSLNA